MKTDFDKRFDKYCEKIMRTMHGEEDCAGRSDGGPCCLEEEGDANQDPWSVRPFVKEFFLSEIIKCLKEFTVEIEKDLANCVRPQEKKYIYYARGWKDGFEGAGYIIKKYFGIN